MSRIMIGADPEMFATYTDSGKVFAMPPIVLRRDYEVFFEENEDHPIFMRDDDGGFLHEDGSAFEISIPPSDDWRVLFDQCHNLMRLFEDKVLAGLPPSVVDMKLAMLPTIAWQVSRWEWEGGDFINSTRFGCNPDKDAWGEFAPPLEFDVMDASRHDERYAGGHLHFSVPGNDEISKRPLQAVESLVFTSGLAAIAYSKNQELEKRRAIRYGKPSKYRVQNYPNGDIGIEYRTPSCSWLGSKDLAEKVFSWGRRGIQNLFLDGALGKVIDLKVPVANAILSADSEMALELLKEVEMRI